MRDVEAAELQGSATLTMPDDLRIPVAEERIPIVEEQAHVLKLSRPIERVRVRTTPLEDHVVLHDTLEHQGLEVTRVPVNREVAEAPLTRTEGDVTIVPVVEERLIVEKRLFLVEEVRLRRTVTSEQVELPTTVRRTAVAVEHEKLDQQEDH